MSTKVPRVIRSLRIGTVKSMGMKGMTMHRCAFGWNSSQVLVITGAWRVGTLGKPRPTILTLKVEGFAHLIDITDPEDDMH